MVGIVGFMPQQIAVGAGTEKSLVFAPRHLAQRERDGTVGIGEAYLADHVFPHSIRARLLATLQYKSAEAQLIAFPARGQDLFFCQFVTRHRRVGCPYAAIVAIVATAVAHLYQSAYIDVMTKLPESHLPRLPMQIFHGIGVCRCQQLPVFVWRESMVSA